MKLIASTDVAQVLREKCLVSTQDSLLVAVSGGADSMALLSLLSKQNWHIEAAHCNFQLREEESEGDAELVRSFCDNLGIRLHTKRFSTEAYAGQNKISIEMAARDLRYSWFNQLLSDHGLDFIISGHHGNDNIETFFLNLIRGTGVKGLTGMAYKNDKVLRPLLGYSQDDILIYCKENQIPYRDDSSNTDTKYLRNKIRHELIPVIETINPSFFKTMQNNMMHLNEAEMLLKHVVEEFRDEVLVDEHDQIIIPISKLQLYAEKRTILFEVLRPYGFNTTVVDEVLEHLDGLSGKQFFSDTHRLIKDRHNLLVLEKKDIEVDHFWVEEGLTLNPIKLLVSAYEKTPDFAFSKTNDQVHFDADTIELPLLVRRWQHGDEFMPLGMKGFKKLSDFFIDNKFSLADKENAWIMISGEDIIWVLGHRIDERFKTTKRTKRILEFKLG
ncbi:tRNA lysidine(34) synthetase TilS [Carboxylicivirga sp. N1Y90]|uniref:tRNA lysidine(34) synthetase TilS n=1 Tax=Carboxylicivirga fragile TaxID=3417571 RepID=UPI003D34EE14|nr:tRNA lysidine(34) synthetase TilS [Marinilabiliaceae bacterium N1Y90]